MPTVEFLKQHTMAQIAPGNPEEFLRLLTEADLRLLEFCKFKWTRTRVTLTPVDGIVTLPADYAGILGAQVSGMPVDIKDESFEFVAGGVGDVEVGGAGGVMLIDNGFDENDLRIYKVTGFLPEGTTIRAWVHYAPVTLYDPDLFDSTVPSDAVTVTRCPSMAALKLAMHGIILEEAEELEKSGGYFATALRNLESKESSQRAGAMPQINPRRGRGTRRIRALR
jgi:hypothetical protein